jgi:hypothetical protein
VRRRTQATGDSPNPIAATSLGSLADPFRNVFRCWSLTRRKLISEATHFKLKDQLEEIARMLTGLIKGLENRGN